MKYFIGWDVGGWNCKANPNSRDAIVILDNARNLIGDPWRGNLRKTINKANSSEEFVSILFELCNATYDAFNVKQVLLSIDTPLGFSQALIDLLVNKQFIGEVEDSASNGYLYRYTERFLFRCGLKPLSPIKDMIGSQATKGMHALSKFAPDIKSCGVWSDGDKLLAIEAYPSACKNSEVMNELISPFVIAKYYEYDSDKEIRQYVAGLDNSDKYDALVCALVGWLQLNDSKKVIQADLDTPDSEGWIFVPVDALNKGFPLLVRDN